MSIAEQSPPTEQTGAPAAAWLPSPEEPGYYPPLPPALRLPPPLYQASPTPLPSLQGKSLLPTSKRHTLGEYALSLPKLPASVIHSILCSLLKERKSPPFKNSAPSQIRCLFPSLVPFQGLHFPHSTSICHLGSRKCSSNSLSPSGYFDHIMHLRTCRQFISIAGAYLNRFRNMYSGILLPRISSVSVPSESCKTA